jgi:2-polyprenyl-3-methyl-5-hydroxy-6-metoxy-1,4-benzoquinol methylase
MSALAARPSPPSLADAPVPPAFAARASERVADLLGRLRWRLLPAPAALVEVLTGQQVTTRAITAAAELGLPDAIADGRATLEALARATRTQPDALARLLRLLVAAGVLRRRGDRYSLTRLGRALRSDAPGSAAGWARYLAADWHWDLWGRLEHSVRTGETAQVAHHGEPFFSWFASRPAEAAVFDAAMDSVTAIVTPAIAAACDLRGCRTVVDVAGGHGVLLSALLAANPAVRGTLFDQPAVIEAARASVPEGVELVAGDMFEAIPEGHDAYVLKWVLHDWDDADAARLLRACRAAARPGARLLIAEMIRPQHERMHAALVLDLAMLLLTGGRERTRGEYEALLAGAGFSLRRVVATASPFSVLVAEAGGA